MSPAGTEARFSIVTAASQVRTSQQAELARENIARLRAATDTVLIEPVLYQKMAGTGRSGPGVLGPQNGPSTHER